MGENIDKSGLKEMFAVVYQPFEAAIDCTFLLSKDFTKKDFSLMWMKKSINFRILQFTVIGPQLQTK